MRKLSLFLITGLSAALFAGNASALSVDPNPVEFHGWKAKGSTEVTVGCEDADCAGQATLTFQTSVTKGKVARQRILVETAGGDVRNATDKGRIPGPDVNIRRIRIKGDGSVEFSFKQSFHRQYISAGKMSDKFWISYDDLAAGDVITITGYRRQIFGSFGAEQATIVPEPSAAMLVLLGMAGLAVAGRRS